MIDFILTYGFLGFAIIGFTSAIFLAHYRSLILAISSLALFVSIFNFGRVHERDEAAVEWQKKIAELNIKIAQLESQSQQVTTQIVTEYVDRVKIVKEKADAIVVKVPVYIDKPADTSCAINNGFVVLHDAAAKNEVPESPRDSHAEASGIKLSTVAATVAENYGTCHEVRQQLESLQDWIKQQQDLYNKNMTD